MDNNKKGLIFNTQKYSISDGRGIRTLVFMKGCPLRCLWCSNPESHFHSIEIMDVKTNCIKCGKCFKACPQNAISPLSYDIDRSKCDSCGKCADVCFANAKKRTGQWMTVSECMEIILKDSVFYDNSNGGVTIGGGEPLMQHDFLLSLLHQCKASLINTAIETSGYGRWDDVKDVFKLVDHTMFDLKCMDSERHKAFTGISNEVILQNAINVANMGKEIVFRIPLIPNHNDDLENIVQTGNFVKQLMKVNQNIAVEILPYHEYGVSKYKWLNKRYPLSDLPKLEEKKVDGIKDTLNQMGINLH